ncbi:MAG: hypothetical protein RLZZ476_2287 [Verrucomicrobiota bacterium]|jgi:hypothetical protein
MTHSLLLVEKESKEKAAMFAAEMDENQST